MMSSVEISSIDDLFQDIPLQAKLSKPLDLPDPLSESELKKEIIEISKNNSSSEENICFLGAGAYYHYIPSIVNHIAGRSEFYTAYTPYQAETSQGMLEAIYEYQSMICRLTGMDASNASMYDAATSLSEAAFLACNYTKRKEIIISKAVHPEYRQVLNTYCEGAKIDIIEADFSNGLTDFEKLRTISTDKTACIIIQHPNFFGCLENVFEIEKIAHAVGALFITSVDPISLGILKKPSDYGADVVVGEGQCLGNSLNFGGPYLGIFAAKKEFLRFMPGRIVGATKDAQNKRGFVLTLQTREQHIRRERATSNICSNEALCALKALVYLSAMGKSGLEKAAKMCLNRSHYAKNEISKIKGYEIPFSAPSFKEFVIKLPHSADEINKKLLNDQIIGGFDLEKFYPELQNHMLLCTTEMISKSDIDKLSRLLKLAV